MKTKIASILLACLALAPAIHAEETHEHTHEKKEAGPNGGRIITSTDPHYEFFVTPERKVKITFLGEDKKPIAPENQYVTATTGERAAPTKMAFVKEGDSLISDKAIPEGNDNPPIILQVKLTADAKTVTEKFNVNLAICPECKHAEYACTCEHEH